MSEISWVMSAAEKFWPNPAAVRLASDKLSVRLDGRLRASTPMLAAESSVVDGPTAVDPKGVPPLYACWELISVRFRAANPLKSPGVANPTARKLLKLSPCIRKFAPLR